MTPGVVLAGKYRIDKVLGTGGMGMVLAAWHLDLEQHVAIKVMLPELTSCPEAVARFLREARAAVKLRNEHVARVFDVGRLETGQPFMVMEMLVGQDMSQVLRASGPLPLDRGVDLFLQACEAIAEAHAAGIVHRDLKPANLFLSQDAYGAPSVKVLDFGISKIRSQGTKPGTELTSTSALIGTPMYMAPEQMQRAKETDGRADVWALGCVLFELLTGRVAFAGEDIAQIVAAVIGGSPPSARTIRPDLPPAVDTVIARCLERDLSKRYQSVSELASDLAPLASARASVSLERLLGAPPSSTTLESAPSADERVPTDRQTGPSAGTTSIHAAWGTAETLRAATAQPTPRRSWLVGVAVVAILAATALAWVGLSRFGPRHTVSDLGSTAGAAIPQLSPASAPSAPTASVETAPADAANSRPAASLSPPRSTQPTRTSHSPTSPVGASPTAERIEDTNTLGTTGPTAPTRRLTNFGGRE
jgi:serine/threonine-protein kinase